MATSLKGMAADKNIPGVRKSDLFPVDPRLIVEKVGFNLRDYDDPDVIEQIENFCDSYTQGRFVPPLIVWVNAEGNIEVIEGHLRRRGAHLAISRGVNVAAVNCIQFRGSDSERIQLMLRSETGLKLKPLSRAEGFLRLSRLGHSNGEIATLMNVTSARVEQLLLLATANMDVQELVRSGEITADTAIEAVRKHGENAGEYLRGELITTGKVTRGTMRGPSLPQKVVSSLASTVQTVVSGLNKATRKRIAELETLDAEMLKGQTIEIDAEALLQLVRAQSEVEEARLKKEKAAAARAAKHSQQELNMADPSEAQS